MTRSHRDPNLESLASAVQQKQRARRRPQAAANTGPLVALILVALIGGGAFLVYTLVKNRDNAQVPPVQVAAAVAEPIAQPPVAHPPVTSHEVTPIQAVSNLRATAPEQDPSVVVTVLSANVGPVELFPVKKQPKPPTPTTSPSKLFGHIPGPEDQPRMSDPLLAVRVRIQNKSGAAITYRSWNNSAPILLDEAQSVYAFYQANDFIPEGRVRVPTTIAPDATIEDILMFEKPAATIRSLDLRLPGQNVGAPQPILISISPSQISGL